MVLSTTKNNNRLTTTTASPYQKRTRNRKRNNNTKELNSGGAGGGNSVGSSGGVRRKSSENYKKKEEKIQQKKYHETITKPVIESSNPFFIAVCAPETYKPSSTISSSCNPFASTSNSIAASTTTTTSASGVDVMPYGGGSGSAGRPRTNVFLRSRPARSMSNSGTAYPNRFIHHPVIQNLRQLVELNTEVVVTDPVVSSNDLQHFPSLGKSDVSSSATVVASAVASTNTTKLNFKEMVMRNSSASTENMTPTTNTNTTTTNASSSASSGLANMVSYRIPPQKSLSSGNIFLAAFHNQSDDYDNDDDYGTDTHGCGDSGGSGGGHVFASSVLIDSCDKKYDSLYR